MFIVAKQNLEIYKFSFRNEKTSTDLFDELICPQVLQIRKTLKHLSERMGIFTHDLSDFLLCSSCK